MALIKNNFRLKLILSYLIVVAVSFGLIAFFLDKNLEENSLRQIKSNLIKQARLINNQSLADNIKSKNSDYLFDLAKSLAAKVDCRVTVIDSSGKVLADSERTREGVLRMENHLDRPEIRSALKEGVGANSRYSATLKINMLYGALPVMENDKPVGFIRLAIPLTNIKEMLAAVRKIIFLTLLFSLGLVLVLGWISIVNIVGPINKITLASRRFARGDFGHRILLNSRDEIGELASTLNMMAQGIEEKIKEVNTQNQYLKAILQSMVEGVIVVNKSGRIMSINPTAERIFEVSKTEAEGRFLLEAIRNNDIFELVREVLKGGGFISEELSLTWPAHKMFQINSTPIFENQVISGCLLVIHDITEIKRLETMRRDFVANVSHELKTPLTSIKGFVETLLEGALEDKDNSRHFLRIILDHTDRLNSLINDLLDLSHLESKEAGLKTEQVILKDLAQEVLSGFKSQLKKKSIKTENGLQQGQVVQADRGQLEQVFTNLVDNAIKFNKENGGINIYAQDQPQAVKITVEDSGCGIPPKDLPRIFERFYRVDKARSRELGGTGLGLSIVKHIVELHGGVVGVESTEDFGSKFWFTLPK